ncbi:MAG: hypothetical protein LBK60_02440 [Verrucomicrobiales bacterium]|jgi:hypothetical protein|nr:hypothetical protein [Verrucomicrobiales bacterium]
MKTISQVLEFHRGAQPAKEFVPRAYHINYAYWLKIMRGKRQLPYNLLFNITTYHRRHHTQEPLTIEFEMNNRPHVWQIYTPPDWAPPPAHQRWPKKKQEVSGD